MPLSPDFKSRVLASVREVPAPTRKETLQRQTWLIAAGLAGALALFFVKGGAARDVAAAVAHRAHQRRDGNLRRRRDVAALHPRPLGAAPPPHRAARRGGPVDGGLRQPGATAISALYGRAGRLAGARRSALPRAQRGGPGG